MVDLSKLSDEQLRSLYKLTEPDTAAKDTKGPDLSKLSDEQLGNLQKQLDVPDDHGYSRRAKMSTAELAVTPITEWPRNYREIRSEAQHQVGRGVEQLSKAISEAKGGLYEPGEAGRLWEGVKGAGNVGLGALGFLFSPASAAYRSVLGQPVEDITGIPREYTEFAAQLATPGIGLSGAAKAPAPALPGFEASRATQVADAVARAREQGVVLPRAITTENPAVKSGAAALSKVPLAGAPLESAVQAVPGKIGQAVERVAGEVGPDLPQNIVGGGIQRTLGKAAQDEAAAAKVAAEAEHAARTKAWEAENAARVQAIEARQAEAANAAEQRFGNVHPMEMAQDTINDVQSAHRQARTQKDARYGEVNNLDARVHQSGFSDLHQRAEQALADAGFTVDDPGSNAAKMLDELRRLSGRPAVLPEKAPPPRMMQALEREYGGNVPASVLEELGFPGGVDAVPPDFRLTGAHGPVGEALPVQGLEQLSKRVGRMGMDAATPGDKAASRIIKGAFDDWRNDVLGSHLTADSEAGAGAVIDAARASHRDLMERFGYNYKRLPEGEPRRAAKLLNQIVTEGAGPEAIRDNLIGAKPGNRPVSAPLYEAISNAVPDAAGFRDRMRGAYWNAASGGSPSAVARNVEGLTPTRMGSHLFDAAEHDLMRNVARVGEETPAQLKEAGRLARENEPKLAKPEIGKAGQLAKDVLGGSAEDVRGTLDSMFRKGGDIKNAARTWGRLNEANRNEFRASWLRSLGGGGEDFNLSKFVKNWDNYSDQGKAIMLNREHRQALNDFHTVAEEYASVLRKYGNPSGTGQHVLWQKLVAGTLKTIKLGATVAAGSHYLGLMGTAAAGLGLRGVAHILATPSGAQQLMRFSRIAKAYDKSPNTATLARLSAASRTLDAQSPAQ